MVTKIGAILRKIRMEKNQILKDMAEVLHVSSAFLSAVENGKKSFPEAWYPILRDYYSLTDEDMDELRQSAMESQKTIALNIINATDHRKQLAVSFARQFDSIDDVTCSRIMKILNDRKQKGDPKE